MYRLQRFRGIKSIVAEEQASTANNVARAMKSTTYIHNKPITLQATNGIVYFNPKATATAANSIKLTTALPELNFITSTGFSVLSTAAADGKIQIIVWDD